MEIAWLEDVVALAAEGSFSRAAERRHVTQPAFSRRIRALEDWAGTPLFDRDRRPVAPTAAGRLLLDEAADILLRLRRVREAMRRHRGPPMLELVATHALSFTFVPRWLRAAGISRDGTRISLMSDTLSGCEAAMHAGAATFLLCHRAPGGLGAPGFRELVVGRDALVAVAVPDLDRSRPRLDYGSRSGLRRIIVSSRPADDGSAPADGAESAFTSQLASVLHELVCHGEGWAWLPLGMAGDDLDAGRLVRRDLEPIPLDIVLLRPVAPLDPASEAFWNAASCAAAPGAGASAPLPDGAPAPREELSPPPAASASG